MSEKNMDHDKSLGSPSRSETSSPRGISSGTGAIGNNDVSNGCVVANSSTGISSTKNSAATASTVSESATTRSTTVISGSGVVASSSSTATTGGSSGSASSTWTSASDTGGASSAALTTSGGGGVAVSAALGVSTAKTSGSSSPRSPKIPRKSRIKLSDLQLESTTKEEWAAKWREQDLYVECLEAQAAAQEGELACLRDSEEKYRQQCFEVSHRERILMRRLASKEQQLLGYVNQITEMKTSQAPTASSLRSALLDPAVNILIQKLRQELLSTKAKLEDTQNELSAWKFTPDSNTGKRLMAKCRLLYQENEELGRMIASGRIAKLEGELVLQKSFSEEVKKSQSELDEFLQDLDEDVEGMQSTIYFLQQELRKARESVSLLQQENNAYKSMSSQAASPSTPQPPPQLPPPQPPPPPPAEGSNLLNGVGSPKREPTDHVGEKSSELETRSSSRMKLDPVKTEANVDDDRESGYTSATTTITTTTTTTTTESSHEKKCDSPGGQVERHQLDEPDESSNDSAALIIKVENEELSDRDEDEAPAAAAAAAAATATSDNRGLQRQGRRKDRTIKSESASDNRSNGDDKSSSRLSSRRLFRERTAKRETSVADSDEDRPLNKKKRRESILSLDYTETDDDALLLTNGESIQSDPEDGP